VEGYPTGYFGSPVFAIAFLCNIRKVTQSQFLRAFKHLEIRMDTGA